MNNKIVVALLVTLLGGAGATFFFWDDIRNALNQSVDAPVEEKKVIGYKYRDAGGNLYFVDSIYNVPEKNRSSAEPIYANDKVRTSGSNTD